MNCVSYRITAKTKEEISFLAQLLNVDDSEIVRQSIYRHLKEVSEANRDRNCTVMVDNQMFSDLKAQSQVSKLPVSRIIYLCTCQYLASFEEISDKTA